MIRVNDVTHDPLFSSSSSSSPPLIGGTKDKKEEEKKKGDENDVTRGLLVGTEGRRTSGPVGILATSFLK
jgi:hypothetical protein